MVLCVCCCCVVVCGGTVLCVFGVAVCLYWRCTHHSAMGGVLHQMVFVLCVSFDRNTCVCCAHVCMFLVRNNPNSKEVDVQCMKLFMCFES